MLNQTKAVLFDPLPLASHLQIKVTRSWRPQRSQKAIQASNGLRITGSFRNERTFANVAVSMEMAVGFQRHTD